jgi:hypothetical protein
VSSRVGNQQLVGNEENRTSNRLGLGQVVGANLEQLLGFGKAIVVSRVVIEGVGSRHQAGQ